MNQFIRKILLWIGIALVILPNHLLAVCIQQNKHGELSVESQPAGRKFQAVVMEFLDPNHSTTGHGIGRLLWREIHEATLDIDDTKVLFACDKDGILKKELNKDDYNAYLQVGYYDATLRIANTLNAQIAVWGVVLADSDALFLQPFLTLIESDSKKWLEFKLDSPNLSTALIARIPHERLRFAPLVTKRDMFFKKTFRVRCAKDSKCLEGIELRKEPKNDPLNIIKPYLKENQEVQALDMQEQWLKIKNPYGGEAAFLNIYFVDIKPPQVQAQMGKDINIRKEPADKSPILASTNATEPFAVLDMQRRGTERNPWFKIQSGTVEGWVNLESVNRLYTFPIVHFIAGLYRYERGGYSRAATEFNLFIARGNKTEDNSTLAAAHQFRAAALLRSDKTHANKKLIAEALDEATKAIDETPYDPGAYAFRACIYIASLQDLEKGLLDLEEALKLNHQHTESRDLLERLQMEMNNAKSPLFKPTPLNKNELDLLQKLLSQYY